MKLIATILLFALSCCGDDMAATSPDAASNAGECMGNLPNSRTITIATGDPIPGALINELQDNAIGFKRKQYTRNFMPQWVVPGSWVGTNGVAGSGFYTTWKSSGVAPGRFYIPFEDGERIIGLSFQAFGNGSASADGDVRYFASMAAAEAATGSTGFIGGFNDLARSAAWGTVTFSSFVQQDLSAGGLLSVLAEPDASGYCIGVWSATFIRP